MRFAGHWGVCISRAGVVLVLLLDLVIFHDPGQAT